MITSSTTGFRLSAQQKRIWSQTIPGISQRAECEVLLEGALDESRLKTAIATAVEQHEILRTVFQTHSGLKMPFQVIQESADFGWTTADFRDLRESERRARIDEWFRTAAMDTDLELGPILRALLGTVEAERHILLLSVPAMCSDARGLENLVATVGHAYANTTAPSSEVELLQYADIVEWQNELLTSEETKGGSEFWRQYCQAIDFSSLQRFLAPFETPRAGTAAPETLVCHLSSDSLRRLEAACDQDGATIPEILFACWHLLWCRLTNQWSITMGCTFDGRSYAELEQPVGPFAKCLPLTLAGEPQQTFAAYLAAAKNSLAEARNWQDSFAWSSLGLPTGLEEGPALPICFEYAALPTGQVFDGISFRVTRLAALPEWSTLMLSGRRRSDGLSLEFHFDSGRLDPLTVQRISAYFQRLLLAACEDPRNPIDALPLLTAELRQELIFERNQTSADYPKQQCLHELFEDQAARTPDRPAVQTGSSQLSYRELNQRANRLAHALRSKGVGADAPVGLFLERGVEMIVGLLGVLKAGGCYVPLSADLPKARLASQLEGVVALVTQEDLSARMPAFGKEVVYLGRNSDRLSTQPDTNPQAPTSPDNLAYIIYTSGSTGTPRGVAVRHKNLVNYASFVTRLLDLDRHRNGLNFATVSTLSADLGNTCVYPSLISGGCLHVIPYEIATDCQRMQDYMAQYPVDVLKIVPSHLSGLLDAGGTRELLPRKYLITGGELFSERLLDRILALEPECEIINHYGPTETTVGSLVLRLKDYNRRFSSARSVPIGKPIGNTRVYVLDKNLQPVPDRVAGELYIAGDGVAAGYYGQPVLTADRFQPDPFFDASEKMYRTGDLVRYLDDGNIEFLGRADDQVKIRGFRVEPSEVEALLSRHPGVKQCVVLARPDERGDKRLIAYVVLQDRLNHTVQNDAPRDLRRYLSELLPEYMVPSAVIVLPRLPLNSNGKVDRQNLPAPDEFSSPANLYVAPRTPTETVLAGIWAEVLRRDSVGVKDNFFEIGGHSLLATQVVSRMRRSLEVEPPLKLFFDSPTVEKLAAWADQARRSGQNGLIPPLQPASRSTPLPLSFAQRRLWVIDQMTPHNPIYNVPRALRLKGKLNVEIFEKALAEIQQRHESLRTTFGVVAGEPVQIISENAGVSLPVRDLSHLEESAREAAAREIARQEACQPFDLAKGPLLRAQLLRLTAEEHVLLLTTHHIVSDAWSAGIFFQELGVIYEALMQGKPDPLPSLAYQYGDYAVWQREWLRGDVLNQQLAYWREQLAGAPPLVALPLDRPRTAAASFDGAVEIVEITPEIAGPLKALSRQKDVTLFMTLLAAFETLLSRYSGQPQIVVGTDVANRTSTQTESMIGFFVNLLPLRVDLSGNPTFTELLGRVRKMTLDAYAHQDVPFDKIVEELQPERAASHNPLVQTLFVMQNVPSSRRALAGLELSGFEVPLLHSKFDLALFVREQGEGLVGAWVYRTALFEPKTIRRIAAHFDKLLRSAIAQPDARIGALEFLSQAEQNQRGSEQKERKRLGRDKLITTEPKPVDRFETEA